MQGFLNHVICSSEGTTDWMKEEDKQGKRGRIERRLSLYQAQWLMGVNKQRNIYIILVQLHESENECQIKPNCLINYIDRQSN